MKDILAILVATALFWLTAELALRGIYTARNAAVSTVVLPYTAAQDWGPVPPWIDGLRILEPDRLLLWRNRPGVERRYLDVYGPAFTETDRLELLQRFWPRVPATLRDRPTWSVSIGRRGFRTADFEDERADGSFRVVCIGDSWTFGANVDQSDAFPQRLAALLSAARPGANVEVLNLGVMGYSSRQGLELLRRRLAGLEADVVVIGFAMNDSVVAGWHDRDSVGVEGPDPRGLLQRSEMLRLARYLWQRARYEPWTIGDYLARVSAAAGSEDELWTGRQAVEQADVEALERLARVSPSEHEAHLREMLRLVRGRGAEAVLLYNELWSTPYRSSVARVAGDEGAHWVDAQALIAAARDRREQALAARLELEPAGSPADRMVLRVHQAGRRVPEALYVVSDHPELGDGVPNRVELRDDGRNGDERAGDGVWSKAVSLDPAERIYLVYTNSGREGIWEGLDVPDLRHFVVPEQPSYRPIETFGELVLQADGWHPDAAGHGLLARALFDHLLNRIP